MCKSNLIQNKNKIFTFFHYSKYFLTWKMLKSFLEVYFFVQISRSYKWVTPKTICGMLSINWSSIIGANQRNARFIVRHSTFARTLCTRSFRKDGLTKEMREKVESRARGWTETVRATATREQRTGRRETQAEGTKRGMKAAMISVLLAPTVRHLSLSRPLITPPFCHCG